MRIITRRDTGLLTQWTFGTLATLDPDAAAFIAAAGITDATQQSAIYALVISMKANGTWTKMIAIYPFVGGTATTHKYNLKDPRDLNAAYRLSFFGGLTHSSNGVAFDGVNSYADTFLTPSGVLAANNNSIGYYSRTVVASSSETAIDIGAVPNEVLDPSLYCLIVRRNTSNLSAFAANSSTTSFAAVTTVSDGSGLFIGSITSSSSRKIYRNNSAIATNTSTGVQSLPPQKLFIGAISNNNVASLFSNRECAFSFVATSLSDAEVGTLYTDIQAFQTTLGRQV
jgi:hypothetical protein